MSGVGVTCDELPFPPGRLRRRVHGSEDLDRFVELGKEIVADIVRLTGSLNLTFGSDGRVLDFGCGCGRVLRFLPREKIPCHMYGTDIDREAIAWCQENLSMLASFSANQFLPPLPYESEFFDFVYSISVFTHLPEDLQFTWLDELRRITKKGGYLLLSTHGTRFFGSIPWRARRRFWRCGFYYHRGKGTEGLPGFYQTSFHHERYIRQHWARFFRVIDIVENGVAGRQDAVLCERTP